jgi:hypothetical protein
MPTQNVITDLFVPLILLIVSINEVYKGFLILFRNQKPLVLVIQLSLLILRFLPINREKRYQIMMDAYEKRINYYGIFTLIGGTFFIWLFIVIMLNALKSIVTP